MSRDAHDRASDGRMILSFIQAASTASDKHNLSQRAEVSAICSPNGVYATMAADGRDMG